MISIRYGLKNNFIDVTDIVNSKLRIGDYLYIPNNDSTRASYFSDPIRRIKKFIFVEIETGKILEYDEKKSISMLNFAIRKKQQ
jgi:hypothetical protein